MRRIEGEHLFVGHFLIVLSIVAVCASCDSDDAPEEEVVVERTFPGVDKRLWPFFIRFEDQASSRGVSVSLAEQGITGVIEEIEEENVAGTCNFNSRRSNHVMIDATFWNAASDLFREFIVFHELGHCALFRDHREDTDEFGRCLSIMRSGVEDCRDNYRTTTRTVYLDELYNTSFANDIFEN